MKKLSVLMLCVSLLIENGRAALSMTQVFFTVNKTADTRSAGLKSLYLVCSSAPVGFVTHFCLPAKVCSNFFAVAD